MIKHFIASALLAATAASSLAAEATPFFVGVDAGSTKFDGISNRVTSYGAFAGYQFNQYVGAELSYRRLGDVTVNATNTSGNIDESAISVLGTLPVGNGFGLLGRYGRTQFKQHGNNIGNDHGNGALFGLGVQYAFIPAMAVRVEVQKPAKGVDNVSASLIYSF